MDEKEMVKECGMKMEGILANLEGDRKENNEIFLMYADSSVGKIRRKAGETLGKKGQKKLEQVYPFLVQHKQNKSVNVRWTVAIALGELAPKDYHVVIEDLRELADDEDWSVREAVASALITINKKCPDAMKDLEDWSKDAKENVRRAVAESLGRGIGQKKPEVTISILEHLLEDDSLYVRKAVANSCRNISRNHADYMLQYLTKWSTITDSELGKWTIADASREIAKQEPGKILPLLKTLAADERKYVQGCVVSVLKEMRKANGDIIEQAMNEWKTAKNENVEKVVLQII